MMTNIIQSNGAITFSTTLYIPGREPRIFDVTIDADPIQELDTLFRIGEAITILAETIQQWIETNNPDEGWRLGAQ